MIQTRDNIPRTQDRVRTTLRGHYRMIDVYNTDASILDSFPAYVLGQSVVAWLQDGCYSSQSNTKLPGLNHQTDITESQSKQLAKLYSSNMNMSKHVSGSDTSRFSKWTCWDFGATRWAVMVSFLSHEDVSLLLYQICPGERQMKKKLDKI